jgi:membrane-bound lytic murein transglycosylase A
MRDYFENASADFDPVAFDQLPGCSADRLEETWRAFSRSCARLIADQAVLRTAASTPRTLFAKAELAVRYSAPGEADIRRYFTDHFQPFKIRPHAAANPYAHGFVTGYYEPEVAASFQRAPGFDEPVRGRPEDLRSGPLVVGSVVYAGSRMTGEGRLQPYWSRAEIDSGKSQAPVILWVRDAIELFMIQVQGSARIVLPGGRVMRLRYHGRNGHPYESIGRILVSEGHIPLSEMSLDSLKSWVRNAGQEPGQPGRTLLHRNQSYIFFKLAENEHPEDGPIGGEGVPLTKLRSLAVDRSIWPYGLPFWVSGRIPVEGAEVRDFQRLMIAQDTGSAIVGAARGDIFFGSGDAAGHAAARIRHEVDMFVLIPKS